LIASVLFPWPWPDAPNRAVVPDSSRVSHSLQADKPYSWGPQVGAMPTDAPWWLGDTTPRAGLYPWPVWGPLPERLSPGSRLLGLATGVSGVVAGALSIAMVGLALYAGLGRSVLGWGEMSLLMIAGSFMGWQPVVLAALLGLLVGLPAEALRRTRGSFGLWLALAVVAVWLGWYWIGPLVQGLFFNATRLLYLLGGTLACLLVLALSLRVFAGKSS
jgi:leader peptidase (prepilin peptidase)/N-methyltransferase